MTTFVGNNAASNIKRHDFVQILLLLKNCAKYGLNPVPFSIRIRNRNFSNVGTGCAYSNWLKSYFTLKSMKKYLKSRTTVSWRAAFAEGYNLLFGKWFQRRTAIYDIRSLVQWGMVLTTQLLRTASLTPKVSKFLKKVLIAVHLKGYVTIPYPSSELPFFSEWASCRRRGTAIVRFPLYGMRPKLAWTFRTAALIRLFKI
jgi:hypothetical protein